MFQVRYVLSAVWLLCTLGIAGCALLGGPPSPTATPSPEALPEVSDECETHTAEMDLLLSSDEVQVGEIVTATLVLRNTGCVALGLPQYRIQMMGNEDALDPMPEPVVHNLGVPPGGKDMAVFVLTAGQDGELSLSGTASFEVHVGYPGPAYWGSAGSGEPVLLRINP